MAERRVSSRKEELVRELVTPNWSIGRGAGAVRGEEIGERHEMGIEKKMFKDMCQVKVNQES
jgi:hypothetical protein